MKDENIFEKILVAAREEFIEKGYINASMRNIAAAAGCTTGTLYSRFAHKGEIFETLVKEGGDRLYNCFLEAQSNFAEFEPMRQLKEMHNYTDKKVEEMIDIIYDYFDAFKLIVCKSGGSDYEFYIDRLVELEVHYTEIYINTLKSMGMRIDPVRRDLSHMLASAMFNGIFEVVAHDLLKEDATKYIKQIQRFFNAGWDEILGVFDK